MPDESVIKSLLEKRTKWVGRVSQDGKRSRKVPIDFDGLLNAVLAGAIPNISTRFADADTPEKCADIVLDYLMSASSISSSHFPTIINKKEAPNYHFQDYSLTADSSSKMETIHWLLTFYYVRVLRKKQRVILGIRTEDRSIEEIIDSFRRVGDEFFFRLKSGKIEREIGNRKISFYLPTSPSATYFTILSLICAILQTLESESYENEGTSSLGFEVLILSNAGGKKWTAVYYPITNLIRIYDIFFRTEDFTPSGKSKLIAFLESLSPQRLRNRNILDSHYAQLSSLSFSILLENYLNVHKLSQIISNKISLELRAKREDHSYHPWTISYVRYVQERFFGGDTMSEDYEKVRNRMRGIAASIGKLSQSGETQRSLLKRIIIDLKNEETPITFVGKLISFLPRLEREGIQVTLPQELGSFPNREFFVAKNEFIVILWNKYIRGGKS
jgi:hypothetical protein